MGSTPGTHSFPSGHVAATVVLYGGIVLLAIVTVFLIRNMTMRIKRLPDEFPDQTSGKKSADEELPPAGSKNLSAK